MTLSTAVIVEDPASDGKFRSNKLAMANQPKTLSPPQPSAEFLFQLLGALLVGFGGVALMTLGFSLARVVISQALALGILSLSGIGAFIYYRRLGGGMPPPLGRSLKLLLGAGASFYLLLWLLAYILPDAENDGLWYHNPTLHFWALKGYVHWIKVDTCPFWNELIDYSWNGYAKGVELINFTILRATGINRFLNAVNLPFLPLGVLGIVCLAALFGTRTSWAVGAGLLFLVVPNNICHAVNAYIGSAVASSYIALFAAAALVIRRLQGRKIPWRYLPALGCALGLGLGSKGTAVVLLPLLILALGGSALLISRKENWLLRIAIFLSLAVIIAGLVGGFWYIRNYIHKGSPLNPIGLRLGGHQIFPGVKIPFQFPPPNTPRNRSWPQITRVLYSWLDNPEDWRTALTEVSHNSGGIGLLWLFGCLPALIWLLGKAGKQTLFPQPEEDPPYRLILPALTLMAAVMFFAMPPRHNHKIRYTLWLYGVGLPCWALAAQQVWSAHGTWRRFWGRFWITVVLAVFLAEGAYSYTVQVKRISLYRQGVREGRFYPGDIIRAFREKYPPGYFLPTLKGSVFERIFPCNEAVALGELNSFDEQKEIIGHLTQGQAFGKRNIYFLGRKTAEDQKSLAEFIKKRRVRYVIWNADWPVPRPLGEMTVLWDRIPRWFYVLVVKPEEIKN